MKLPFGNILNYDDDITVQIDDAPKSVLVSLNPKDNLSNIREKLKQNSQMEMNDTLSFAMKNRETNNLAEIAREDEGKKILNDIIEENGKILYLTKNSKPDWKFLNEKCKLEYGRTITPDGIKKANKRAFIMKDCNLTEIGSEGYRQDLIEFNSNEDKVTKTELSFTGDIDVQDFAKFGLSTRKSKSKNSKSETSSFCKFTEFGKVSLKFSEYLEPTPEFIKTVEDAIESKDHVKFKEIIEEFGRFVPKEVILGGRAYCEGIKNLKESSEGNTNKVAISVGAPVLNFGIENNNEDSSGNTDHFKHECLKFIGGKQPDDEQAWAKSLDDFRNWDCIKFHDPISIFKLLSEELQKKIFSFIGKKILYSNNEDYKYELKAFGTPKLHELDIPSNISKIIRNKDANCNFFATVIDTEETKNDIFNCQILCPPEGNPICMIHCIQKKFKERKCKLQIGWMVVGYDINFNFINSDFNVQLEVLRNDFNATSNLDRKEFLNFEYNSLIKKVPCFGIPVLSTLEPSNNSLVIGHHFFQEINRIGTYTFSYCSKNNHYVNLPDFTFYTLIISKYLDSNNYGLSSFKSKKKSSKSNPKYISLHSTGENHCGPIFLKQKHDKIKIKFNHDRCNRDLCICGNKKLKESENDLEYAFFDPIQVLSDDHR